MAMESDGAIIEVRKIGRSFENRAVLSGIEFEVRRGEIFGILGPDGSGKTTLLQILAGILDPTQGRACVLGFDTVRQSSAVTGRVGYMAQGFTLYHTLTVEENLRFAAEIRDVPMEAWTERRDRLLEMAGSMTCRDRRSGKLSGGMQKKLSLCTNLIHEPPLLLLDELSLGVDPLSRHELWQMLRRFREQGKAILITTPYMDEAAFCDRVALLHEGRLLSVDTPASLRAKSRDRTFELITARPSEAAARLQTAPDVSGLQMLADRLRFTVAEWPASEDLVTGISDFGELRPVEPTLEDVFIQQTQPEVLYGRDAEPAPSALDRPDLMRPEPAEIRVCNLTVRFGTFTAVDRVSLEIGPGEIFGLLGPNGAGKTTVIRALCGLIKPDGGTLEVAGLDALRERRGLRGRIGYMSQQFSLYPDLTVVENLGFFAGAQGLRGRVKRQAMQWAAAMTGLKEWEETLAARLSGAVRQRLALACAVVHRPRVLFLDEPTSGVDPRARRRFWRLVYGLAETGIPVLVTTHYLEEADYCHRLGLMDAGRLIAVGSQAELRAGLGRPTATPEAIFLGYIQRQREAVGRPSP